jgi:hypothetical protein
MKFSINLKDIKVVEGLEFLYTCDTVESGPITYMSLHAKNIFLSKGGRVESGQVELNQTCRVELSIFSS